MKKITSLFLVVLLLLNVMGFYGFFLGMQYKNSQQVIKRLDADNYEHSETVTIKIPLVVPYYGDTDYERVDGEIEHNGEVYRLVKQKLQKDTLHIVCIKDIKGKKIKKALTEYVKTFADQSADHSKTKTIPSFIKDYVQAYFHLGASAAGWNLQLTYKGVESLFTTPGLSNFSPPPEV